MHQILLGALDHIVRKAGEGGGGGGGTPHKLLMLWNKIFYLNLGLFQKNYSSYNRIYIFLEYLIPKRIFDIF